MGWFYIPGFILFEMYFFFLRLFVGCFGFLILFVCWTNKFKASVFLVFFLLFFTYLYKLAFHIFFIFIIFILYLDNYSFYLNKNSLKKIILKHFVTIYIIAQASFRRSKKWKNMKYLKTNNWPVSKLTANWNLK